MKRLLFPLILILALLTGCKKEKSETVDPDHIQQEIWSIYYADNIDTYYGIRFYDTDWYKRVLIDPPSSITLNGYKMTLNNLNSFYEVNYDNELVQTGLFIYTDVLGRIYKNTVEVQKSIELPAIDTLYKNKDNVINWVGDPCSGSPEIITFHLGLVLPSFVVTTSQAGATSLTIKAGEIQGGEGFIRIRIDRESTSPLQQGTQVGGKITRRYQSHVKWVYVK